MNYFWFLSLIIPTLVLYFFTSTAPKRTALPFPPGPRQLPIIGNLHLLGKHPHHDLAKLSRAHGSILTLKLGQMKAIVISSPSAAKEALQKNDQFLDRWIPAIAHVLDYADNSILFLSPNKLWKQLWNICFAHVFSNKSLEATEKMPREKVRELVEFFRAEAGKPVDVGQAAFVAFFSIISSSLFSDISHLRPEAAREFRELLATLIDILGKPTISDFFPVLQPFDVKGWRQRRRATLCLQKLYSFLDEIIDRRLKSRPVDTTNNFLDVLVQIHDESNLERKAIVTLLTDLLTAEAHTTTVAFEWAMMEILRNPSILAKARAELDEVIGTRREVNESDITNLPYLEAVIKEVLRLHPPAAMVDRKIMDDVELGGYSVPKGTRLLVNLWALGRDENVWSLPEMYMPERFLGSRVDFRGRDFELMSFGLGRRLCPGMPMAIPILHLTLASILRKFEWKLPRGMEPASVDMREHFGPTLTLVAPPLAVPIPVKTS